MKIFIILAFATLWPVGVVLAYYAHKFLSVKLQMLKNKEFKSLM